MEHGFLILGRHEHAVGVDDLLLLEVVHFLEAINDLLQAVDPLELNSRQHVLVLPRSAVVQDEGLLVLPLQEVDLPRALQLSIDLMQLLVEGLLLQRLGPVFLDLPQDVFLLSSNPLNLLLLQRSDGLDNMLVKNANFHEVIQEVRLHL